MRHALSMAASDEQISDALSDAALELANRGAVKRYKVGSREMETHDPEKLVKASMMMRALNSSRRGVNLGKIDRPA
jgi:hypothetical protein